MSPKISNDEKEKRRLQIIQAAEEVFKRKGYEPATMADIVEETGMSRGWVYIYFSGKEEIFRALLEELDLQSRKHFNSIMQSDIDVWDGISELLDKMSFELEKQQDPLAMVIYEYFLSGWRDSDRRDYLKKRYIEQHQFLISLLQKGVNSGEFHPKTQLEVIIKMTTSFIEGLQIHCYAASPEQVFAKEQIALYKGILNNLLN